MKLKKWALRARSITVELDGLNGLAAEEIHIADSKGKRIRGRTLVHTSEPGLLSEIMAEVEARLSKDGLQVEPGSYRLVRDGGTLFARVSAPARPDAAGTGVTRKSS